MSRYGVSWVFTHGDQVVRRHLFSDRVETCIEAARLINQHANTSEVEVAEVATGEPVEWKAFHSWVILCSDRATS